MNTQKLYLLSISIILGSLIFSGCTTTQVTESLDQMGIQTGDLQNPVTEEKKKEVENLLSLQDQLSEIVTEGDASRCQELSLEQFVVSCEVNILSAQAKTASDTGVCDKASTDDIKARCVATVELKK